MVRAARPWTLEALCWRLRLGRTTWCELVRVSTHGINRLRAWISQTWPVPALSGPVKVTRARWQKLSSEGPVRSALRKGSSHVPSVLCSQRKLYGFCVWGRERSHWTGCVRGGWAFHMCCQAASHRGSIMMRSQPCYYDRRASCFLPFISESRTKKKKTVC